MARIKYKKLKKHIHEVKLKHKDIYDFPTNLPSTITYLNLEDNNLTKLPLFLSELYPHLKILILCNNHISCISRVKFPPKIKYLDLSHNSVDIVPENLPKSLKTLLLNNNNISTIPNNLPKTLIKLDLNHNQLTVIPNAPNSLKKLWLNNNNITEFNNLPNSLTEIYLMNNNIDILPANLSNKLKKIDLDDNKLTKLPTKLPTSIQCLWFRDNNIISISSKLYKIKHKLIYNKIEKANLFKNGAIISLAKYRKNKKFIEGVIVLNYLHNKIRLPLNICFIIAKL